MLTWMPRLPVPSYRYAGVGYVIGALRGRFYQERDVVSAEDSWPPRRAMRYSVCRTCQHRPYWRGPQGSRRPSFHVLRDGEEFVDLVDLGGCHNRARDSAAHGGDMLQV